MRKILVLIAALGLFVSCTSWLGVHRFCQETATRVLQASDQLPPDLRQENYRRAYVSCVKAHGFEERLKDSQIGP